MQIKFSKHAEQRMTERNITKGQVIEALTPPTKITSGKGEKFVASKNGIRVVYAITNSQIVVVTVTRE